MQSVAKKRLGRGLDALLSTPTPAPDSAAETEQLKLIAVDLLQRGKYQPRLDMRQEALEDLANSIRAQGVVQPIVVRAVGKTDFGIQRFEIIAGERRWRAAQIAGLHEIPAIVRDVPDEHAVALALIENIQREDLNPLEEGVALKRLIEEFDLTHEQAATAVGRSRAAVSNLLRLLELGDESRELLTKRRIEMGHGRALLALSGNEQDETARTVASRGLSVRETERLVQRLRGREPGVSKKAAPSMDPDVKRLQDELGERLGTRVTVKTKPKGKGELVIRYNSLNELDGILKRIR
jgi:ParB family transcriptional regulator, chromosome partitioning protein